MSSHGASPITVPPSPNKNLRMVSRSALSIVTGPSFWGYPFHFQIWSSQLFIFATFSSFLTASPDSTVPFDLVGFLRRTRPELIQDQDKDEDEDNEDEDAEADASHGQLAYCKFNDILQGSRFLR